MGTMTGSQHFAPPRRYRNYVSGEEVAAHSEATFGSVNPTSGKHWGDFSLSGPHDIDAAVRSADRTFRGAWGALPPIKRGKLLARWGELIAREGTEIATVEATQNGKLLSELRVQTAVVEDWLAYYGRLSSQIEGSVIPLTRRSVLNYTLREPVGVVGAILPWNSPTLHTVMAVAPALSAGNTVVIKPSESTSASAVEIAKLALEAGIPPGVVKVVTGAREAGVALVDHPLVARISFIGSVPAGRAIGEPAGRRLIGTTLELGGKSPNIVFADADLEAAEAGIVAGIFAAPGQSCIAGSRVYIHASISHALVTRLVERAKAIRNGDPLLPGTQMGPVANKHQFDKDRIMVERAVAGGTELLCGGTAIDVEGFPGGLFFAPAVLHKTSSSNSVIREEVFGPVLSVDAFQERRRGGRAC